ncbi:putative glucosylceramidase 4 [Oppia nitens]|uniref:putative glucosylceramidase 4 n=1 Tax=Oppia nitens TaxID=1686743 RepID=UPI0023DAD4AA|nr:putative glucosylceramidase 4 [Oppia nitens]
MHNKSTVFNERKLCQHRNYGYDSTVCVCSNWKCDNGLPPIQRTPYGKVVAYLTTKSGDRLQESHIDFGHTLSNELFAKRTVPKLTITVDSSKKYQSIIGFGGSFTDAVGINIDKLSPKLQFRLIRDYYSTDGLEYTMGRIPIGGTDFSTHRYTYDDDHIDDFELNFWNLTVEDTKYKIPFIRKAMSISSGRNLKLLAATWSPPAWMKNNSMLTDGGFLIGQPGGKYYKTFANYIVKFINAYKAEGVPIWAISPQNEPYLKIRVNFNPINNLQLSPELESDFIRLDLAPALHKSGNQAVNIIAYDDQSRWLRQFAQVIFDDRQTSRLVAGMAYHWYTNPLTDYSDFDWLHQSYPMKFILSTESCVLRFLETKRVHLGAWDAFDKYAYNIIKDLNYWVNGWVDWNLALDEQGGPNWFNGFVDSPIIINTTGNEYYKQPMYYCLAHFSKFLPPDSVRIGHQRTAAAVTDQLIVDTQIKSTSFIRPDTGIVVIVLNTGSEAVDLKIVDKQNRADIWFEWRAPPKSLQSILELNIHFPHFDGSNNPWHNNQNRESCIPRNYGYASTVCVCTTSQCDTGLPNIQRTRGQKVSVYVTTVDGDRLRETKFNFGHTIANSLVFGDQRATKLTLTVDSSQKHQSIVGFGGAVTDATGITVGALSDDLQTRLIKDYYSADGLEYIFSRIPIGGSDFSTHGYTYDDDHIDDFDLKFWNLTIEDTKYKIPFLKKAIANSPNVLKFFATTWSPPVWMKNSTTFNGGGFIKDQPGGKYYKTFANYIVKFIDSYKSNGVPIWGVTPQNEAYFKIKKGFYPFNNVQFTPELQRDFIKKDLGPALFQSGNKDVKIMIYDDQSLWIKEFAQIVLSDPRANRLVDVQ